MRPPLMLRPAMRPPLMLPASPVTPRSPGIRRRSRLLPRRALERTPVYPQMPRLPPQRARPSPGQPSRRLPCRRPLARAGVALGVASGRPRPPEEPPAGGKTPPTAIVGGVIGLAIVVALAAWFLLIQPKDNTASASPSPAPTVLVVSPSPTAIATDEPTAEPTDETTPEPTPFKAPTFTGRSIDEAQDLASSGGLELDITYDTTTNEPDGTVLSQVPEPGTEVLPGDQIFLVVAQPGPTVLVPNVVGVPAEDALNLLIDSDLRPGERTDAVDADVAAGAIISTDPSAGEEIDRGSSVDYVVSVGPEATAEPTPAPVAVPDVRDVAVEDALNQLLDAGLEPGERTDAFDDEVATGAVIGTDPEAGTEVAPGTTIDYLVSQGVEPTPTPEPTLAPVAVPDLRGVPSEDALGQLIDAGLEPGRRSDAFDAEVPLDAIISTDPAAGEELEPGSRVDYLVSKGVEPVAVPDLRDVAADDAVSALIDAGLQPGTRSDAFDDEVAAGAVVSTTPEAGTEVAPGSTIDYVVSSGPEPTPTPEPTPAPVAVPDLRGVPAEDALNQLIDAGLEPGRRSEAFDAEVALGAIVSTDPAAGEQLEPGSRVDYLVSKGVEPVAVPDLRGVAAEDALNQLLDAGLQPGTRTDAFDDEVAAGAVVSTTPEAGTEVAPGTTIDYLVSRGVEPVVVPDLRGVPAEDALNQLDDAGLESGDRTDAFDNEVAAGSLVSTDPAAGAQVAPGTAVDYVVSRGVQPVAIPDVRGVPAEDALNQLIDAGLQPGTRSDAFDDEVAAGAVVSTTPEAGTEVAPGSTIDYVVSSGPEPTPTPEPTPAPVAVPDLRGVPAEDALNQLIDAGLEPGRRSDAFDAEVAAGAVISTDPTAGVQVVPGTTVDYLVSSGPEPTPTPEPTPAPVAVPDVRGFTADDAVNALIDAGLQPGTRTDAFDDEVAAGAVVSTGSPGAEHRGRSRVPPSTTSCPAAQSPRRPPSPLPHPSLSPIFAASRPTTP